MSEYPKVVWKQISRTESEATVYQTAADEFPEVFVELNLSQHFVIKNNVFYGIADIAASPLEWMP